MLNSIYDFLMKRTSDGATYLQTLILCVLLFGMVCLIAKQIIDFVKNSKKELDETETEIDQQELFKQIHYHVPIDGYQVFSERQNGTRYTVTFLSRNNDNCILAEVEDFTDPNGAIKIIQF